MAAPRTRQGPREFSPLPVLAGGAPALLPSPAGRVMPAPRATTEVPDLRTSGATAGSRLTVAVLTVPAPLRH